MGIRDNLEEHLEHLKNMTKGEHNLHQAVDELFDDVIGFVEQNESDYNDQVINRMLYPDRVINFSVAWVDDEGGLQVNQGWRVQFNNAIGPYKGGLRLHPKVSLDDFKFLGFEQTFKDALTGLPMGGAKGGSDFNPKGRSNPEIRRFCQSFMTELSRYIGPDQDIPAGDIGVGGRELGYMFGHYKQLTGKFHGALTGKGPSFGGSCIRTEATGYGTVYFLEQVLIDQDEKLKGKRCALSGAGNVSLYCAQKLIEKDAVVLTLSDSKGVLRCEEGFTQEQITDLIELKETNHGALKDYKETLSDTQGLEYTEGGNVWKGEYDIAIPSATQNEVDEAEAEAIVKAGATIMCQAANMPCTHAAVEVFKSSDVQNLPSKAVNAGGVAVSGLERAQNAMGMSWTSERVDDELKSIMKNIVKACQDNGRLEGDKVDYSRGANIAGFKRVYKAMAAYYG